jgi:photosystem II stability/assembly factor-like uncharacterized protein
MPAGTSFKEGTMGLTRVALKAALTATVLITQAVAQASAPHISSGPNILVSRDGDFPHVELTVAANPKQSKNLIGGAIAASRPQGGWGSKAYVTQDGGYSWTAVILTEGLGVDPQVAFAPNGTAYFLALGGVRDKEGKTTMGAVFYSSHDAGVSWSKPIPAAFGVDHPQLVVDQTAGKRAGRIYVAYLGSAPGEYVIDVVASDDEGKSFSAPVRAARNDGQAEGINVNTPLVLSDGTLIVPYAGFQHTHDATQPVTVARSGVYVVASTDGGTTFSGPFKVEDRHVSIAEERVATFPVFAADAADGKYRDRIYAAWTDWRSGAGRILFSSSSDRGRTWSRAFPIDAAVPAKSLQYQPTVAVNSSGVVGIRWFDTRHSSDIDHYDEYFTASVDGGATFLKPVRVSSATSEMLGNGNLRLMPQAMRMMGTLRIIMLSATARWRQGGEYMALVADADGVFHSFWSDARSGTSQVWTSRISVGSDPANVQVAADAQSSDVTSRVQVVFDPATYDSRTAELRLPVRLKNVSDRPIAAPLTLTISHFGSGMGEELREFAPEVLNANNKEKGAGAMFDYSGAMGNVAMLAPGAQTEAVTWHLRFPNQAKIPDLHVQVSGRTEAATQPASPPAKHQH